MGKGESWKGVRAMNQFLESKDLLQTIAGETELLNDSARQLVTGLNDEQLNWKPAPDSWSIAQCLDHLAVTSSKFDPYFSQAISRDREKRPLIAAPKYQPSIVGGWLIKQVMPVTGRNLPAPKVFRPSQ